MDLISLASCNLANDFTLVFAMMLTFSGGNPYTVKDAPELAAAPLYGTQLATDDGADRPPPAKTREAAIVELKRLQASGGAPLIGLLPVPPAWAALFQRTPSDLLDPCVNISIATAMVSEFEYACGPKAERACVLQHYEKAAGVELFGDDVLETIKNRDMPKSADAVVETDDILGASVFASDAQARDWGADRLFFAPRDSQSHTARAVGREGGGAKPKPAGMVPSKTSGDR